MTLKIDQNYLEQKKITQQLLDSKKSAHKLYFIFKYELIEY